MGGGEFMLAQRIYAYVRCTKPSANENRQRCATRRKLRFSSIAETTKQIDLYPSIALTRSMHSDQFRDCIGGRQNEAIADQGYIVSAELLEPRLLLSLGNGGGPGWIPDKADEIELVCCRARCSPSAFP